MKRKFFVALNVDIDGQVYEHGSTIEIDLETAKLYNHALRLVEDVKEDGDGRSS